MFGAPSSAKLARQFKNLLDIGATMLSSKQQAEGITWPPIIPPGPGAVANVVAMLETSQWLPAEQILENQLLQVASVVRHAYMTVPFYHQRLAGIGFDPFQDTFNHSNFRQLPLLQRHDIQQDPKSLYSDQLPPSHGHAYDGKTSGSTGRPIHFRGTGLVSNFWKALNIRDHLWQKRDFQGSYAVIRALVPNDRQYPNWGRATAGIFETGPSYSLDIRNDIDTQIHWLQERKPTYFLTYPANLRGILDRCRARGLHFPELKQINTISETLDPDIPGLCQEVLGIPMSDCYGAEETGHIALQCPDSGLYHIQSEHLLVEILNDKDEPCSPGEMGRVVITTLANFAMPLIRYEIMDYAIAGPPCPCGRGLTTLTRILGRRRNLVTLPDGRRYWPLFGFHQWMDAFPIEQMQLIQKSLTQVEVRYVSSRSLVGKELQILGHTIQRALRYPFSLRFVAVRHIARRANGKFEDFISEIDHVGS